MGLFIDNILRTSREFHRAHKPDGRCGDRPYFQQSKSLLGITKARSTSRPLGRESPMGLDSLLDCLYSLETAVICQPNYRRVVTHRLFAHDVNVATQLTAFSPANAGLSALSEGIKTPFYHDRMSCYTHPIGITVLTAECSLIGLWLNYGSMKCILSCRLHGSRSSKSFP